MLERYGKITEYRNIDSETANQQGFYFRINGQNCKIMTYKGNEEMVRIPDAINGKPVRAIGKRAFAKKNICNVVFPNELKIIGEEAFYQCKLKRVELPEQIEKIEQNAFGECKELETVMLKGKRKSFNVSWHGFAKTPFVDSQDLVILGNMLLRINAVDEETETLKIPQGIEVVAKDAADNGEMRYDAEYSITKIEIPSSVKKIQKKAFRRLWRLGTVDVEYIEGCQFLYLERDAFGSLNDISNSFMHKLKQKHFGSISVFWDIGVQRLKHLELTYYSGSYLCTHTSFDEGNIYIPPSRKDREAFWDCIRLNYIPHREFYFSLNLEDYYNLMMKVTSIREQLQMATFLVSQMGGSWKEKVILFFQEHINKAVEIAVKENDVEQLKLYAYFHLIEKEKGFRIRHGKYLIEKYQNRATAYLKQLI